MKIKVLNIIKRKGKKWEYNGRFYYNGQWIPVLGTVANYKTESQIKRAIIKRIKGQAETYKVEQNIPQEKTLTPNDVFKPTLAQL